MSIRRLWVPLKINVVLMSPDRSVGRGLAHGKTPQVKTLFSEASSRLVWTVSTPGFGVCCDLQHLGIPEVGEQTPPR